MHRLRLTLAAAAAGLAGCGGGGGEPVASSPTPTPAASTAAAGQPAVRFDLRRDPDAWPALGGGKLPLRDAVPVLAAAAKPVGPPSRVEAEVVLPSRGRAGVFCGRYGLAVAADGRFALYRLTQDAAPEQVLAGRLEPGGRSDPGEPTLVRLLCAERSAGRPVSLGFMINASPLRFAEDRDPGGEEQPGRVGAFGLGPGGEARYLAFAASDSLQ